MKNISKIKRDNEIKNNAVKPYWWQYRLLYRCIFVQQAYTNKDHGIRGGANKHLIQEMTDIIKKSFGITTTSEGEGSATE